MAVNLPSLEPLVPIEGFRVSACGAGVRKADRPDLVLIEAPPGTAAAACFTRNRFRAAPVLVAEAHLEAASPRYLLINSGNANAGTGGPGLAAAQACCSAVAGACGVPETLVLPFSTGVIGEPLPVDRIVGAIPGLAAGLAPERWADAARAIMTTDTAPKALSMTTADGATLTGIAKGAGMIRPDMATMLAFVATDAAIAPDVLRTLTRRAVDRSFNRITVDGDTSTNDAIVVLAGGSRGATIEAPDGPAAQAFGATLEALCRELAQRIVRDGEGATRFVTVSVAGARDEEEARRVAFTVAESPLVKTALFAGDPNWGRILAAVGRAGIDDLAVEGVELALGDVIIARKGAVAPDYTEAAGARVMAEAEIEIRLALGRGDATFEAWTTDLSHDYVRINAEYRT